MMTLAAAEAAIDNALRGAWMTVALALYTIRAGRLWENGHYESFEDYVQRRWRYGRAYAFKMASAGEVLGNLSTIADSPPMPASVDQAAALAPYPPELQRAAWTFIQHATLDNGNSARYVKAVAQELAELHRTGAINLSDGHQASLSVIAQSMAPAVTEAAYESMQRQREYIRADKSPALLNERFASLTAALHVAGALGYSGPVRIVIYPIDEEKMP